MFFYNYRYTDYSIVQNPVLIVMALYCSLNYNTVDDIKPELPIIRNIL